MLPTVIVASREAIRAVPDSIRQGAFALGATQWQVVWRQVLPAAIPGIATGSILALARAIGETAPLLLVGALTYVAVDPTILGSFTALPVQIYQWITRPQEEFRAARRGRDHGAARDPADDERVRDLAPQPLPTTMVRDDMESSTATPARIAGVDEKLLERNELRGLRAPRGALRGVRPAVAYSGVPALKNVSLEIYKNYVTAFIGPSGCGKSTFIRCFNRMNDLIPSAAIDGRILYHGLDLYGPEVDAVEVRKRIGMVFQKPNPFPKSIYDNIAFGPRVLGLKDNMDDRVEKALRQAALWDEVKSRLKASALQPLRRTAAAALHRPLPRRRARRAAHGRARLGARPDLDDRDRGSHAQPEGALHDRDRHPQHAAGGPRRRHDGVLQRRGRRGERQPHRHPRRVRRDADDLHQARRPADRGLRDRRFG